MTRLVLAEHIVECESIVLDHRQRCTRLGVLLIKTAEDWMKANPPNL